MYLLNSLRISEYLEKHIENFVEANLQHTYYYFTLGSSGKKNGIPFNLEDSNDEKAFLELEPGDFAVISTHEHFSLPQNIMGIIGSNTDLAFNGIQLLHSPFLDPGYRGKLKFGIANVGKEKFPLKYMDSQIGKISFFSVSDTHPIIIEEDSIFANKVKKALSLEKK